MRKILHIDMDAFYASVEQRDNPELRGKPIAVGGGEKRGVLTTCSYEARVFGVRSAMPGFKAKALCPDIIFVKPRFDAYYEVSKKIREIFSRYTDLIEPLSLDEAYLDVTECKLPLVYATDIALAIKKDIHEELDLTASAGVSYSKFIAKVASDINKPDGLTVIKPHQAEAFLEELAIDKFYGVGKVTARKMKDLGIAKGADLKKWRRVDLIKAFGKVGGFYHDIVRGIDNRPVTPHRERKSVGVERTVDENLTTLIELEEKIEEIVDKLVLRLQKHEKYGRTITLKLKNASFDILTRSKTKGSPISSSAEIRVIALSLLRDNFEQDMSIRLVGLTSSNFEKEPLDDDPNGQLSFEW